MDIAYTAHTETCTLLLDAEGICRSVLAVSSRASSNGGARPTRIPCSAERCVGAQYVATLDVREPGAMTAIPAPGAQMLFAKTEKNGRITLIRSAPVVRFESSAPKRIESGVHERPEEPAAKKVSYGDDDELTLTCDAPTIRGTRSSLPAAPQLGRGQGRPRCARIEHPTPGTPPTRSGPQHRLRRHPDPATRRPRGRAAGVRPLPDPAREPADEPVRPAEAPLASSASAPRNGTSIRGPTSARPADRRVEEPAGARARPSRLDTPLP